MSIILHEYLRWLVVYTHHGDIIMFHTFSCFHTHCVVVLPLRSLSVFSHTSGPWSYSCTPQVHGYVLIYLRWTAGLNIPQVHTSLCSCKSQCAIYTCSIRRIFTPDSGYSTLTLLRFSKEESRGLGGVRATKRRLFSMWQIQEKMLSFAQCLCATFSRQDVEHQTRSAGFSHRPALLKAGLQCFLLTLVHLLPCSANV